MVSKIKKPSVFLQLTEGARYVMDMIKAFLFVSNYKFNRKGDKHPVLVIPGLMCTDFSTMMLRKFIDKLGYTSYGWTLGRNLGDLKDLNDIRKLQKRVAEIRQKHNGKITLIGWSMGGIYARELAKLEPELYHQVITTGAPFADAYAPNNVEWFYNYVLGNQEDIDVNWREQMPVPAKIRTTALYSKQDGLVPWEACREIIEDDLHQNIEITGSHWGLVTNAEVFKIIAEQLPFSEINNSTLIDMEKTYRSEVVIFDKN